MKKFFIDSNEYQSRRKCAWERHKEKTDSVEKEVCLLREGEREREREWESEWEREWEREREIQIKKQEIKAIKILKEVEVAITVCTIIATFVFKLWWPQNSKEDENGDLKTWGKSFN